MYKHFPDTTEMLCGQASILFSVCFCARKVQMKSWRQSWVNFEMFCLTPAQDKQSTASQKNHYVFRTLTLTSTQNKFTRNKYVPSGLDWGEELCVLICQFSFSSAGEGCFIQYAQRSHGSVNIQQTVIIQPLLSHTWDTGNTKNIINRMYIFLTTY